MRMIAGWSLAMVVGAADSITAQARPETPESVVRAYFQAVAERRWRDAAQFVDPAFIERVRGHTISWAGDAGRVVTVEEHMRRDPDMPRAVAEYFVRGAERSMRAFGNEISNQFAMVEDTIALKALSPMEAAARYVQATDRRYVFSRSYRMLPGCADSVPDDATLNEFAPRHEILASVVRGDTAWVMYRDTSRISMQEVTGPEIAALRRVHGRWLVDLERAPGRSSGTLYALECTKIDSAGVRRP